ncbi:hypothetical protein HMPREF3052_07365 [Neisseria sp. HMSC056A03]|uniref:hypothetical protein n=1 Tax=Neisseria sp. HMSC056A03 TaxID=1739544 RepID=UPI0008A2745F|nr:hypothetical protein [Neisseria sp. HMSC056A03]OFO27538.1 hypothetical protein HMPREF3052_07365 [Neisseria sp. HMSC056A03]
MPKFISALVVLGLSLSLTGCLESEPKPQAVSINQGKILEKNVLVGLWHIDELPMDAPKNAYYLSRVETAGSDNHIYGTHIEFDKDGRFSSSYSAECGNECFPHSEGLYRFVSDDEVILQATKVEQRGDCGENGEFKKSGEWVLGKFKIEKDKEFVVLKKIL